MPSLPESSAPPIRALHDAGAMALLILTLVPVYLLFNHYWQSLILLLVFYGLLSLLCVRLGRLLRRTLRRLPAEIPPWTHAEDLRPVSALGLEKYHRSAEALQSIRTDPHYVQEVFKPRLRELIAYRLSGNAALGFETLTPAQLAQLDTSLSAYLQRQEATTWWARYRQRQRRVQDALVMLRQVESL